MYYLFTEMYTRDMYKYRESFSGMTSWPCSKTDLVVFTSYYLDRYRYLFIPIYLQIGSSYYLLYSLVIK